MASENEGQRPALSTAPYKGARDFYPEQQRLHEWVFARMREVVEAFGYEPYNAPMLEPLGLYAAKSGRELVEEQVYILTDRGGREVAVRPEMTPSLARMVAARLPELVFPLRWFSFPNLWRYERPQRGRTREHWQLNVDLIGVASIEAEAEVLEVAVRLMEKLGATSKDCQVNFSNRKFLNEYLQAEAGLDPAQRYAISKAIDRKEKVTTEAYLEMLQQNGLDAKQVDKILTLTSLKMADIEQRYAERFAGARELVELWRRLVQTGIADYCTLNLGVVRGLDYYTSTVFEMFDLHPDNRRAIFGGGRYDDLIALFNGQKMPAIGFGLGDVTVKDFLATHNLLPPLGPNAQVLIAIPQESTRVLSQAVARRLRDAGIRTEVYLEENVKLQKQLKYADRRGVPIVIMIGEEEQRADSVTVKDLRKRSQEAVRTGELIDYLKKALQPEDRADANA